MQTQESLTLNDLRLMAQIIKVVSSRGAIQADEMIAVGTLYNKLGAFITAATPVEEGSAEPSNEAAPDSEGEPING